MIELPNEFGWPAAPDFKRWHVARYNASCRDHCAASDGDPFEHDRARPHKRRWSDSNRARGRRCIAQTLVHFDRMKVGVVNIATAADERVLEYFDAILGDNRGVGDSGALADD